MNTPQSDALARLKEILHDNQAAEDRLAEAVLLLGQTNNPAVDVAGCLRQIDDWAGYLLSTLSGQDADAEERIANLNRFLFDELGFTGNNEDHTDPQNSFLDAVIERRLGIPITLSVLYIELGRRIGLPLQGVSFPGHFLVILPVSHGAVVLDPYAEGVSLEFSDLERILFEAQPERNWEPDQVRHLLVGADLRDILVEVLRSLKVSYREASDLLNAIWVQDLLLTIDERLVEERRDRGFLYEQAGRYLAASADFAAYLDQLPNASDAETIRARLIELTRQKRRLH